MTDPFELRTPAQRAVAFVGFVLYFALVAVDIVTGNPDAVALGDLVIAAMAIPAGLVVLRRVAAARETEPLVALAGVAFLVAGVGVGYGGVVGLTDLPAVPAADLAGSLGLIVAVLLYLYYSWT